MKIWKKIKKEETGDTLFTWRHRATSRFFMKIGSWVLGGFVFAIFAAIVISIFPRPPKYVEDQIPWFVFFIVFFMGLTNAFIRNIYNGLEFRIMKNGIGNVKPRYGFELLGFDKKEGLHPFGEYYEVISWDDIKEIKEQDNGILLNIKNTQDPLPVMVSPVVSYFESAGEMVLAHKGALKFFSRDAQADKEAQRLVVQKARDAKRIFHPSS